MTVALTENELSFKNAALTKATNAIVKARNGAVSAYLTIGEKLKEIRDSKLYKDDFPKFEDYINEVFGLSKATAYRMIAVTTRFLLPEKDPKADKFFSDFEDSALGALLNAPVAPTAEDSGSGSLYQATRDFCDQHAIDTTTSVAEIRKIVKEAKEGLDVETGGDNSEIEATATVVKSKGDVPKAEDVPLKLTDVQQDGINNTIAVIMSFLARVEKDVKDGMISERDFKALSDIHNIIK